MNEKTWKAFLKIMKEAHGMEEAEVLRYLNDDTLLEEKITELKAEPTNSFKDGLNDGMKKAKATLIKSLKKELDIEIGDVDKIEKIGEVIKPVLEAKFKTDPANPKDESETIKSLKKAHEAEIDKITKEKDAEISKAKTEADKTSRMVKMDAVARKLLAEEGYSVPKEKPNADLKFEMAMAFLDKKGYNYEFDEKDNKFYRIGEDNLRVRKGNKPVSYEDDLREIYEVNYGKSPAKGKDSAGLPNQPAGGGGTTEFDWSKYSNKSIPVPTTLEQAMGNVRNPVISLEDRKLIRDFIEAEQAKAMAEPAPAE